MEEKVKIYKLGGGKKAEKHFQTKVVAENVQCTYPK